MSDFDLTNENVDSWEKAEFWEYDPMLTEHGICSIILYIDWESKKVTVETQMHTNSTSMRVWNGLASDFSLPEDTDFEQFAEFYRDEIQPILQKIGEGFESEWDGSNWKGRFSEEAHSLLWSLDQKLEESPKHDMCYYLSLRDSYEYGGISQLKSDLETDGIDILTADLDNKEIMETAVNAVTWNDGSEYKLIDVDVEVELREIQKELQEEEDE